MEGELGVVWGNGKFIHRNDKKGRRTRARHFRTDNIFFTEFFHPKKNQEYPSCKEKQKT